MSIEIRKKEKLQQLEAWAYLSTHPSKRFNSFCYDDDEDYTIVVTPSLSIEDPDNSLSMGDEHLDTISATESDEFIKFSVENLISIPSESEGIPEHICDMPIHDNSPPLDVSKDQFEDLSNSNEEFSSTDEDSFSIDNIDYVEASPPDYKLVSSEVMEIVILEVGGIDDDILTIKDDILREKLLNVNLLIAKIEALNDNLTPSFDCKTKSSSTSLNSLLEETNTFNNSLPEFETFCFDVEEISSGSTTTHYDISLPEYEVFYDDHVKEISNSNPTTHSDSSLYASFIFDLSINPFPPADRSDFYEFADELIYFISLPEYDCFLFKVEPNCFLFKVEPNSRDFTKDVVEDISPTKEPQQYLDELKRLSNLEYHDEIKIAELKENFNGMSIEIREKEKLQQLEQWAYLSTHPSKRFNSFCYDDDDEEYTLAVTPSLSTEEPDNSLSMGDEHLDTIPATESDEFIKSSVENLIPIPNQIEDLSESTEKFSSIDDDSLSIDNIDYVEASLPDSELVSSEVVEIVISEVGGIDDDILLTIKNDIISEIL
uniref:Reverse transcriptase domain-containing protein n=1 Tax=Tanacetum cinerariifolium TaxID=118510 RepID=A0A699IB49_TANCI|nr:hypothetical protein [Tanacetum cinerariifolium]